MNHRTIEAVDFLIHVAALLIGFGITMIVMKVTEPVQEAPQEVIQVRTLPKLIPDIEPKIKREPKELTSDFEEELEMSALFYAVEPIGRYYITAYSHMETGSKITASGGKVHQGNITTCAADVPKYFRFGDYIEVGGRIYRVEDTGSAVKRKHIDIYIPELKKVKNYNSHYETIYKVTFPFGKPQD